MTRSELSPHSPRVVRKVCLLLDRRYNFGGLTPYQAFRAQAASKGLSYREAILSTKAKEEAEGKKVEKPAGIIRRNPGRMDGVQWNGDSFVCARQVDGDEPRALHGLTWDDDGIEHLENEPRPRNEPMVISLLDIARPAKQRGAFRDFMPRIRTEICFRCYKESASTTSYRA
jgi:hypothetical protein